MKSKKALRMQDVANAAGVHKTTVSMALRGHPGIPEKTRLKIKAIAEKMGYRPNPLVSALMIQLRSQLPSESHEVIAYVTSYPPDDPWRKQVALVEMFNGAKTRAAELGFGMEEFDLLQPGMNAERIKNILLARGIRGVVLSPLYRGADHIDIDLTFFATVALGVSIQSPSLERVANDHFQSLRLAMKKCTDLGYKRIGFVIMNDYSERLEGRWLGGYLYEQRMLPIDRRLEPLLLDPLNWRSWLPDMKDWCSCERPDAILSPLGVDQEKWLQFFRQLPGPPGVVNLTLPPSVTNFAGIQQDAFKLGQIAAGRLVSRLQQNEIGPFSQTQNTLLHGAWLDGPTLPSRMGPLGVSTE